MPWIKMGSFKKLLLCKSSPSLLKGTEHAPRQKASGSGHWVKVSSKLKWIVTVMMISLSMLGILVLRNSRPSCGWAMSRCCLNWKPVCLAYWHRTALSPILPNSSSLSTLISAALRRKMLKGRTKVSPFPRVAEVRTHWTQYAGRLWGGKNSQFFCSVTAKSPPNPDLLGGRQGWG